MWQMIVQMPLFQHHLSYQPLGLHYAQRLLPTSRPIAGVPTSNSCELRVHSRKGASLCIQVQGRNEMNRPHPLITDR